MLACVVFGSLASVVAAIYALTMGATFKDAFALYLALSFFAIVGVPFLCAMRRQVVRRSQEARRQLST